MSVSDPERPDLHTLQWLELRNGRSSLDNERVNWWLSLIANLAVLCGLVFVGYEVRQNTVQLRAESSRSLTESVNDLNAGVYSDADFAAVLLKGEEDRELLSPVERSQFDAYQFSRLNIAEYVLDLEREGISDLNFRYVDWIVSDFNKRPGLRAFIRDREKSYVGSPKLLLRLLGEPVE
jgi:hypothetical protein